MTAGPKLVVAIVTLLLALLVIPAAVHASPPAQDSGTQRAPIEVDADGHVIVPEASDEAMAWYRGGNLLWVLGRAWAVLIPALLLLMGWSAKLRDWTRRLGKRAGPAMLMFLVAYALVVFVASLPLSFYGGYVRPHAYGLSDQALAKWVSDWFTRLGLFIVGLWLFVPGTLWFARKSPQRWWIWTSLVVIPIAFVLVMLAPVLIDPLFNELGPMKDPSLEAEILALAERAGIEGGRVFEIEKSVDTKTVNAYVTGLGATKRIVLWDTIIARLERDELLVVMGHEMGHYVLAHVLTSMVLITLAIPLALWLVHVSAKALVARHAARFGFDELGDVAALPLLLALIGILSFVAMPLINAWSRHQEHESDRFALELTHDNQACARAFVALQRSNLGNPRPGPLFVLWRGSHPTLGQRIDFCNEYRPWETGEPEIYAELFGE